MQQHVTTASGARPHLADLLAQIDYLRALPPGAIQAIAAAATWHRYGADCVIFQEGDAVGDLFVVQAGMVKISRLSLDGREHILLLVQPGETFNEVAVLDGGPSPATATAHGDTTVWRVARDDLQAIALSYPQLAWAMAAYLAGRTRHLVGLVEDLSLRNVRGRLARLLLDASQAAQADIVPRLLSQEEMAAQLGTVREVVNRTLRNLADEGMIQFDRHRIVILQPQRLAQEAEV